MKKILLSLTILSALVFSSCNLSPVNRNEPVNIGLKIDQNTLSAASVTVDVTLDDDRVYYLCGILHDSTLQEMNDRQRFMQLQVDRSYKEYIDWRYILLVENTAAFIATYSSHSLLYGNCTLTFDDLLAQSGYTVYAFCVNPDTKEPIGDLFTQHVTTLERRQSNMTFKIRMNERSDGPIVTIIPSNDDEPYFWEVDESRIVKQDYNDDMVLFALERIELYKKYDVGENLVDRGFYQYNGLKLFNEEQEYTLVVTGYDGGITTPVYFGRFTFPFTCDTLALSATL